MAAENDTSKKAVQPSKAPGKGNGSAPEKTTAVGVANSVSKSVKGGEKRITVLKPGFPFKQGSKRDAAYQIITQSQTVAQAYTQAEKESVRMNPVRFDKAVEKGFIKLEG